MTQNRDIPAPRNDAAIAVAVAYFLIAVYWSLNATGLAFYTALLQASLLGRYSATLSVVMLWLPPVLAYSYFAGREERTARRARMSLPVRRVAALTPVG